MLVLSWVLISSPASSQSAPLVLDQDCSVSILNRTIFANEEGRFAMPNVPSFLGQIRARATCVRDGETISGQTDYFTVITNDTIDSGAFYTDNQEEIPVSLAFASGNELTIFGAGTTQQLLVTATYADDSQREVTAASNGTNYTASNTEIVTVDADGLVTAVATGTALVSARKDGVIVVTRVTVSDSGDSDGDGLPDDY